jgi:hypothetical protein
MNGKPGENIRDISNVIIFCQESNLQIRIYREK